MFATGAASETSPTNAPVQEPAKETEDAIDKSIERLLFDGDFTSTNLPTDLPSNVPVSSPASSLGSHTPGARPKYSVTTAQKKQARVQKTWSLQYQLIVKDKKSKSLSPELPKSSLFYVTVIVVTSRKGWDLQWDDFPFEYNITYKLKFTRLTVHDEGAKEVIFNKNYQAQLNIEEKENQNKTKISPELQIYSEFIAMGSGVHQTTTSYDCIYVKQKALIIWNICQENDHISDDSYI